ncbi:hypothetical protein BR93DRAFT_924433 [Coniochaeta sp. PMI_546]|nr:hypothetical protein BR93DRAFT_924433 [Coniochaeta sp. PMI_546]
METLPPEILGAVAFELAVADVRHFRLVSRRCANAGFPALVRNISFLNTTQSADALQTLRQSPYASFGSTRHLNIYDGSWPLVSSLEEWANHFLGRDSRHCTQASIQHAYKCYQDFIQREVLRTLETDIQLFRTLLVGFPSLREVTLSHVHAWRTQRLNLVHFRNLTNNIWMLPFFESFVSEAMVRLLPAIEDYPHVKRLNVDGLLDPRDLPIASHTTIQFLCLNSILAGEGLKESITCFLGSFPELTSLTIRTSPVGPIHHQRLPLNQLQWSNLRFLAIACTWISEDELLSFIERHNLRRLVLKQIVLTDGSWKSFFNRIRRLQLRPKIVIRGLFTATGSLLVLPYSESQRLLDHFLKHKDFPWPFADRDGDVPVFRLSP